MKIRCFVVFVLLAVLAMQVSGVDQEAVPPAVTGYYRDFNHLTLYELQPLRDGLTTPFALQSPPPGISAALTLRDRLFARRLQPDPRFSKGLTPRIPHEQVFLQVKSFRRTGDRIVVLCEVYEPGLPLPEVASELQADAALSTLNFQGMKLLRRETQQWQKIGEEWKLKGAIQELLTAA